MLEYFVYGHGTKAVVAMHGFGQSGIAFKELADALGDEFRVISISLPYHAGSSTTVDHYMTGDLVSIVSALADLEGAERFTLLGYSTGGRLAMCITPQLAARLNGLILLAPDGVIHHPLYYFATKTKLGRLLHKLFVSNQAVVYQLAMLAVKMGLVRKVQLKFLKLNSESNERRRLAFDTWGVFRRMEPDLSQVRSACKEYQVRTVLYYGRYDRIIPARQGLQFKKVVGGHVELHVLRKGHSLTRSDVLQVVAAGIKKSRPSMNGI